MGIAITTTDIHEIFNILFLFSATKTICMHYFNSYMFQKICQLMRLVGVKSPFAPTLLTSNETDSFSTNEEALIGINLLNTIQSINIINDN